jgi:hypothetical protein
MPMNSVDLGQIADGILHARKPPDRFGGEIRDFGHIGPLGSDGVEVIRNWTWTKKIDTIPIY